MTPHHWRMGFHLMPPVGWINDPNGLCQFKGTYYVFYQYSPEWPDADAPRGWGLATSNDLLCWQHHGMVIEPTEDFEASGSYSGAAYVVPEAANDSSDLLRLYYTGNVKEPGEHDYVLSGRQANQIIIDTVDGHTLGNKHLALTNADYPASCSCHVRDPQVWRDEAGTWWMMLGAREKNDTGLVLIMRSDDGLSWSYSHSVHSASVLGFMWECPNRISLDGREWLGICPQGVADKPWAYGERDVAGYVPVQQGLITSGAEQTDVVVDTEQFRTWDSGFDFYAPQAFVDDAGRTILIGWMGLPEPTWDCAPDGLSWIHCLTVPRQITAGSNATLLQYPVAELEQLRGAEVELDGTSAQVAEHRADLIATRNEGTDSLRVALDDAVEILASDTSLTVRFLSEKIGAGRTERTVTCSTVREMRVLIDNSALEVFANRGERVFATRWFPREDALTVQVDGHATAHLWEMRDGMQGTYED